MEKTPWPKSLWAAAVPPSSPPPLSMPVLMPDPLCSLLHTAFWGMTQNQPFCQLRTQSLHPFWWRTNPAWHSHRLLPTLARPRQHNSSTTKSSAIFWLYPNPTGGKTDSSPRGRPGRSAQGTHSRSSWNPLPCSAPGWSWPRHPLCTGAESGSFLLLTNREQQYLLNMSSFSALLCILPLLSRDKSTQTIIRISFVPNTNTFLLFLALTVTDFFPLCF